MPRKITQIVVHHSVSAWGTAEDIRHWHTDPPPKGNGWNLAGYHVVICNAFPTYNAYHNGKPDPTADGRREKLVAEEQVANGALYVNPISLHVCLIGDLDKAPPTAAQYSALIEQLVEWCKKYKLGAGDIYGHGEMQRKIGKEGYSKTCPGLKVNMQGVREAVANKL